MQSYVHLYSTNPQNIKILDFKLMTSAHENCLIVLFCWLVNETCDQAFHIRRLMSHFSASGLTDFTCICLNSVHFSTHNGVAPELCHLPDPHGGQQDLPDV